MTVISYQLAASFITTQHTGLAGEPKLHDFSLLGEGRHGVGGRTDTQQLARHVCGMEQSPGATGVAGLQTKLLRASSWEPSRLVCCRLTVCRHSPGSSPGGRGLLPCLLPRPGTAAQSGRVESICRCCEQRRPFRADRHWELFFPSSFPSWLASAFSDPRGEQV